MRTMDRLMRWPVRAEAERGRFLVSDVVVNADEVQFSCWTVSLKTLHSITFLKAQMPYTTHHRASMHYSTITHRPEHDMPHLPADQCVPLPGPPDQVQAMPELVSCKCPLSSH